MPPTVPVFARGHRTPNYAEVVSGRVRVTKEDPVWRGNAGWRGDGTVPMISAIPPEMGEVPEQWHAAVDTHGALAGTSAMKDLMLSLLGSALPIRGADTPDRPWIGFDTDELVWSSDGFVVGAEVMDAAQELDSGPGQHATLAIADGRINMQINMELRDGSWYATVDGLAPGVYEVNVEVSASKLSRTDSPVSIWGSTQLVVSEPGAGWELDRAKNTMDTRLTDDTGAQDAGGREGA